VSIVIVLITDRLSIWFGFALPKRQSFRGAAKYRTYYRLQQSPTFRATSSAQHLRPSGVFCCRTNCLELTAWWRTWSGTFWRPFQTVVKDVFVFTVLVCSAH